jgi:C-terminal processing protease CtpA/Prc
MSRFHMHRSLLRLTISLSAALACMACRAGEHAARPVAAAPQRVANLHAFARLYGVVRWFHPSDAAAVIDWNRFAVDGVRRVLDARDAAALDAALAELFAPLAPTVHLVRGGAAFPDEPALHPPDAAQLDVIAWQHKGFGDSAVPSVYASKRSHRARTVPVAGYPYGALWQQVDAEPYRGSRVRLRGKIRTASPGRGQLWLRVDRGDTPGFSDDMRDRPLASARWATVEISGMVARDATRIVIGTQMSGTGTAWFDDIELAVQSADGSWAPIALVDPGFEAGDPLASWKPGLARSSGGTLSGWRATVDRDGPASGAQALRVEPETHAVQDELFAELPQPGETLDLELGGGLRARVPIALFSRDGHTIGDDPAAARRSQAALSVVPAGFDAVAGAADVIVAWNALQHFWPYWDVAGVDWLAELDVALADALDDRTVDDHVATLQRLSAAAPDGHARIACAGKARRSHAPIAVDVIEGEIVVTATSSPELQRGDVIVAVDGHPAHAMFEADEALASGSPQFRRVRARAQFAAGPSGSAVRLQIRRRGRDYDVTVARDDGDAELPAPPAIQQLDDGIYQVDLVHVSMRELDAAMAKLAAAPGIVFDVRGHPTGVHALLSHLLTRPDDSRWMNVAHVVRPDHGSTAVVGWDAVGFGLPVLDPHIPGRIAFLINADTASYGESIMGLVEHYRLGAIVGSPTAGANGNFVQITEPTGCSSVFTGMRVVKSDGSRFHLIGIQPTIPVTPTIAGIAAGRDEVLDAALAYVRRAAR